MAIDQTNAQSNIFYEFIPSAGGWTSAATTETISFTGGCINLVPVPTCVVTTDACSLSATEFDLTKVKCTVVSGPNY